MQHSMGDTSVIAFNKDEYKVVLATILAPDH